MIIRHGDEITRQAGIDALDELRDGLTHDRDCELGLPRDPRACAGCRVDHTIAMITRDLWDGYTLADTLAGVERARHSLPYGLGCTVLDTVTAIRD